MTGNAPLRQSNESRLADKVTPDSMKSEPKKAEETGEHIVDNIASYIPGQSKARDAFNPDAANPTHNGVDVNHGTADAFKPSGNQSVGEWVNAKAGEAVAFVTPNQQKSTTADLKDTVTPGHDSSLTPDGPSTGQQNQGVLSAIGRSVADAKDAVVGALGGANQGAHDATKKNEL